MKFRIYFLSALIFSGLYTVSVSAQEQQPVNQTTTTTQETQTQSQTAVQTQKPAAPKPKPFPEDLNIAGQFDYAIEKSSNFQDYKVIKQAWVLKIKQNALDSLKTLNTNLASIKELADEKNESIKSLQAELNVAQQEVKEKNSFKFLGFMVSKAGYDSIMWSIIAGLVVALGIMLAAFKRSYAVTNQTKKDLNEVKDEYENYRKKALKSKEEAVRHLYDELNKYKNR